jgi:ubiquinone/menaquinone biosynthesis C-methylase UbiE
MSVVAPVAPPALAPAPPMEAATEAVETRFASRDHTFEWFSSLPAYQAMNRAQLHAFLSDVDRTSPWQGVDVACGLGLMTELCHDIASQTGASIDWIACVDMDRAVLNLARKKLASRPAYCIQSVGQRLPVRSGTAIFVVIGNGIHNFADEDKASLLREAFRVLRPGGKLFFNSSFFDGCVVEGTERYWLENVRGALRLVGRSGRKDMREEGAAALVDKKPEAMRVLTRQDYMDAARTAGFTDVTCQVAELRFDQELMEAICSYSLYSLGALHFRYPPEIACPAMRQAAHDLFSDPDWEQKYPGRVEADGRRYIPRRVLWVTARRPDIRPSGT